MQHTTPDRRPRRPLLSLAAGVALAVSITGPAIGPASAAEDNPIRIGALMPLSGAGGPFGQNMLAAAKAALADINAAGGPLGRQIELIEENSETNPEQAVRAARKLVDVDDVIAIFGTWASGVTLAVAPVAQENQVVEMSTSGSSRITEIQKDGFVYRTEPDDLLFGKAYAEFGIRQGWKTASVLGLNVPFTETTVAAFRERFESQGGKVLAYITYNEEQTTFRSEVIQALSDNPDFTHISGYGPDVTAILKTTYQSGLEAGYLLPGFAVTDGLIKDAGPAAEGIMLVEEGVDESSPAYKRVQEALGGDRYYSFAAQAYDQIQLLALAIEAAGEATGSGINARLHAVSGPPGTKVSSFAEGAKILRDGGEIDYEGAAGPINFDENGNIATANFRVSQVKDGEVTPIHELPNVTF